MPTSRPSSIKYNTWLQAMLLPPLPISSNTALQGNCMQEGRFHLHSLSSSLEWSSWWVPELTEQKEAVFAHSHCIFYSNNFPCFPRKRWHTEQECQIADPACRPFNTSVTMWRTTDLDKHPNTAVPVVVHRTAICDLLSWAHHEEDCVWNHPISLRLIKSFLLLQKWKLVQLLKNSQLKM